MRRPDLPGYGTRTDPMALEDRTCAGCRGVFAVDLNGRNPRRNRCDECEADLRVDRADARQAQIARNVERGA